MATLNLDNIKQGMPEITKEWGYFMAQAGMVCFDHHNHATGVTLAVKGAHKSDYDVI